jgi:hypothetical protein
MTLPFGLYVCEVCGDVAGTVAAVNSPHFGRRSRCLCEGWLCPECGRLIRYPTSDLYDPRTRRWWHVPVFMAWGHGVNCRSPRRPR